MTTYILKELVEVESIESVDRVVERSMSSVDGSSQFIHRVVNQMSSAHHVLLHRL